jgi:hypothetical protein
VECKKVDGFLTILQQNRRIIKEDGWCEVGRSGVEGCLVMNSG